MPAFLGTLWFFCTFTSFTALSHPELLQQRCMLHERALFSNCSLSLAVSAMNSVMRHLLLLGRDDP